MGRLTTHVLDTALGRPTAGIPVRLRGQGPDARLLCETATNADGRCDAPLLGGNSFEAGRHELTFLVGGHFARNAACVPDPPFPDEIVLRFGIAEPRQHHHVPLPASPWTYSTCRGS